MNQAYKDMPDVVKTHNDPARRLVFFYVTKAEYILILCVKELRGCI